MFGRKSHQIFYYFVFKSSSTYKVIKQAVLNYEQRHHENNYFTFLSLRIQNSDRFYKAGYKISTFNFKFNLVTD